MAGTRSVLWPVAKPIFVVALLLFVITIAIGILNGLDLYDPAPDALLTHVHAGTLGWITLAVGGTGLLAFTRDRDLDDAEIRTARLLGWSLTAAITVYVVAFLVGDALPGDRIHRPIVGTVLFAVTIWYAVWLYRQNRAAAQSSVVRLGIFLSWISLILGALLGVLLGLYTSQGEVPGLPNDTAAALAEAHPPAMVIGFLVLAAAAIAEWLIREPRSLRDDRWGAAQMWIIFAAGILINVAIIADSEALLGPANGLEILGAGILLVRLGRHLLPGGWRGAGVGLYGRMSLVFLVVNLLVLTYLVAQITSGSFDLDAPTEENLGLLLTLDHLMFLGVMTNALFGVLAKGSHPYSLEIADRVLLWGANIGLVVFAVGLVTVNAALKRIGTPLLGAALFVAIVMYIADLDRSVTQMPEHAGG